jgi:hypothetical protein
MNTVEDKKTGNVIFQPESFWLKIEQKVLDLKKAGVKITKAELGARLMQIGYLHEYSDQ